MKGPSLICCLFFMMNSKGSYLQTKLLWNFVFYNIKPISLPASLELYMKGPSWSFILKLAFFLALTKFTSSALMIYL